MDPGAQSRKRKATSTADDRGSAAASRQQYLEELASMTAPGDRDIVRAQMSAEDSIQNYRRWRGKNEE